jgi:hypothetical protein
MEATTIKIYRGTKAALDGLRRGSESYDETIRTLISRTRMEQLKGDLKEGYMAKAEEDKCLVAEWDHTSPEFD